MAVHFVAPLFFLEHMTARWMAAAFVLGGMIMGWMHMKMGITRLMGLGHAPWLVPMALIFADLWSGTFSGGYHNWLIAAAIIGTACLLIDVIDVMRYLRGDRTQFAPPAPV